MAIRDVIERLKNNFGTYPNEAAVSQGIVLPLLQSLGWDVFETRTVWPEYSISGRRVDYALCYPSSKPKVFVEVKQVGMSDGADRQLFEYAFHEGIPLAVLTDGRVWNFFLPSGQGNYSERKFYVLDILSQDIDESVTRFERYLKFENIKNDLALQFANEDYRDSSHRRLARETLPQAWASMLNKPSTEIVDALVTIAESISGFTPDRQSVLDFIKNKTQGAPDNVVNGFSRTNLNFNPRQDNIDQRLNQPSETVKWVWPDRKAEGYEVENQFLVKAGALIVSRPRESLTGGSLDKYNEICNSQLVRQIGQDYELVKDYFFKSKAQATNVLCGHSESANRVWLEKRE